jgi:hypothetical protein
VDENVVEKIVKLGRCKIKKKVKSDIHTKSIQPSKAHSTPPLLSHWAEK